jgi:Protein of unknown function (DUF2934)
MQASSAAKRTTDLNEAIGRRAREIYEKSGRIPGHDIENWIRAEAEILSEQKCADRKSAVVVRVDGVQYVGEYQPTSAEGYTPGEFTTGDPVPIRFQGDQMFVRRRNGKELATKLVRKAS